jgi:hypothetical protein
MVGDSLNHSPLTLVQPDGRFAADRCSEVNSSVRHVGKSAGYGVDPGGGASCQDIPVSQSSVGDCRMTNTSPIMSTGIWRAAVLSSSGTPARISLAANHMRASSPGRAWRRHGRLEAARGESSASHIGVFWCVRTHRWFSVLSKRLSVCDFFVELSRSRPTIDPRGRFAISRLTLFLGRLADGPGAFRHTPPSLGSQQFRCKPRPGLEGL